jgi:hypothetical protein
MFMPEHRRQFSPQFKAEAVQMVIEAGEPVAAVVTFAASQEEMAPGPVAMCEKRDAGQFHRLLSQDR